MSIKTELPRSRWPRCLTGGCFHTTKARPEAAASLGHRRRPDWGRSCRPTAIRCEQDLLWRLSPLRFRSTVRCLPRQHIRHHSAAATTTDDRLEDRPEPFLWTRFLTRTGMHPGSGPAAGFRRTALIVVPSPARILSHPRPDTRPARSSPRAGHLFSREIYGPCTQLGRRCAGLRRLETAITSWR